MIFDACSVADTNTFKLGMTFIFLFYRGHTELGDITPHNIKQLKLLNQVVFPVTYNDKFYKDVLEVGELAKLGTYCYYSNLLL